MGFIKGFFKYLLNSLFFTAVLTLSLQVFAEELSKVDSEALQKTVELLQNKSQREQAIQKNPRAKKTDDMTKQLFGNGADLETAYKAAAEIFRKLAGDSKGDAQQMMEKLSNAQQNPEQFYNSLDPEQKKMIQSLSKGVEQNNQKPNP